MTTLERLQEFRDKFRRYAKIYEMITTTIKFKWPPGSLDEERRLREDLAEKLGELGPILRRLPGVSLSCNSARNGKSIPVLDVALSPFNSDPDKKLALTMAGHILAKAIGAARAAGQARLRALARPTPSIFLAHAFRPEIEKVLRHVTQLSRAVGFRVTTGEPPEARRVAEKVTERIVAADITVALMTADEPKDKPSLPSQWVTQEATEAHAIGKPVIRIIERGVSKEGRLFADAEYIELDLKDPVEGLVRYARMLAAEKQRLWQARKGKSSVKAAGKKP